MPVVQKEKSRGALEVVGRLDSQTQAVRLPTWQIGDQPI
jgi:hypothetical protein